METVLRGTESAEMIPLRWDAPILYYPVRHHSPACAWHLKKTIERYAPDCILIEGPENANDLLPVLASPKTKPPVALYYSYRDDAGLLAQDDKPAEGEPAEDAGASPEPESCKCYYPFLSASPELVALRMAAERGIPARFMDLPYGEILLATKSARGLRTEQEKQSYASDRHLAANKFQALLCEKAGVRSFEEYWEKYFEIAGLHCPTEDFIRQMYTYCCLSRENTPRVEMEEDGGLAREAHMAARIAEASAQYGRVLAVTGGFHVWGLLHPEPQETPGEKIPAGAQHVYPMRYSLEAADALNGYASGMPAPAFYGRVWERLSADETAAAYAQTALDLLVSTGRKLRHDGSTISVFDEACAQQMMQGLAGLRQKSQPGLYELQDAVLSAFVKGEASLSGTEPLRILRKIATGDKVGELCDGTLVPPLVTDFEAQMKRFSIKTVTARQDYTLSVFSSQRHRSMSRFFYQSAFLDCGYAALKKGPDLIHRKDRNLIRESWECKWSSSVNAELIDHSVSGATMLEACHTELRQRMAKAARAEQGAELLVQGFLMGLGDAADALASRLELLLSQDGDFASLCRACSSLNMLAELQDSYRERGSYDYDALLRVCFGKILQMLPGMADVDDAMLNRVQRACMLLYQLTERPAFAARRQPLADALSETVQRRPIHPGMHGAALGLLYGMDSAWKAQIEQACAGYLRGTHDQMLRSAAFLQGLFYTARDLVLVGDDFVRQIDTLFCALSDEDYVMLLPELRLAFSYFTPTEQDRIARWAAALHGRSGSQPIRRRAAVSPQEYTAGEALDAWVAARMDTGGENSVDEEAEQDAE